MKDLCETVNGLHHAFHSYIDPQPHRCSLRIHVCTEPSGGADVLNSGSSFVYVLLGLFQDLG